MLRKIRIISVILILVMALPFPVSAGSGESFRIYNPSTITSNLDATYIQGDVRAANGQKIEVKSVNGLIAEKQLPNTGEKYTFRIKIPRSAINEKHINSYAVTAKNSKGEKIRTTYFRVRYKPRKEQEIILEEKEFEVQLPGETVTIGASSSAGLDLKYSSSDEDVVKVDDEGNIEPVGEGTAEVAVIQSNDTEYEDVSETVTVSVTEVPHYTVRLHLGKNASTGQEDAGFEEEAENTEDTVVEQKIAVGEETELLAADEKKGDYEFLGWSTTATGYPTYANSEEVKDLAEVDQTIDLYAVWHGERAQEAVDWAVALAADDRYGYGQGTSWCNICGKMPKKQFTCMPFLAASYAHGPEDPIMLAGGKHVIHLHDGNFKGELGQIWEKVGLCKNLTIDDLEPGDVVIKYSGDDAHGHAWMYVGDDLLVEASPASSYAAQIAVKGGAAARLKSYSSGRNFVMRYRF